MSTFLCFFLFFIYIAVEDFLHLKSYRNSLYSKREKLVGGLEHSQQNPPSPMTENLIQTEARNDMGFLRVRAS